MPLRSHRCSFIDSFSFGKERCNTLQSFGAFFAQSCDRLLFPFYLFSHFFLSGFLDFITTIVVEFLIKQLFYSGLLDIKWLSIIRYPAHPRRIIVKYFHTRKKLLFVVYSNKYLPFVIYLEQVINFNTHLFDHRVV